jgi:hypothetical protein
MRIDSWNPASCETLEYYSIYSLLIMILCKWSRGQKTAFPCGGGLCICGMSLFLLMQYHEKEKDGWNDQSFSQELRLKYYKYPYTVDISRVCQNGLLVLLSASGPLYIRFTLQAA